MRNYHHAILEYRILYHNILCHTIPYDKLRLSVFRVVGAVR